jgi:pilus assembly protein CpaC
MYVSSSALGSALRGPCGRCTVCGLLPFAFAVLSLVAVPARGQGIIQDRGIVQKITSSSDQLELTVNTSQILTLGSRIPRIQVNNPDLVSVTALSATEIQVAAKKVGVTTINLWDENGKIYSLDVTILGDARELELALRTQFPNSSIKVYKYTSSLVLKGFVDRPDYISQIQKIAEDYSPKIVNNISVGGVHQVMLKVKLMEVSRTKMRALGIDWEIFGSEGGSVKSTASGILDDVERDVMDGAVEYLSTTSGAETLSFAVFNGGEALFAFLEALEVHGLGKILAEPVLTTISGRPARFHVGGEIGYLVAQPGVNQANTVEFRPFGTEVDFLPIVLGNGNIRLEVRPKVSQIDQTLGDAGIPGFRTRTVDTGVEMKSGQTLALAGLIQQQVRAENRGIPILSQVPYLGIPFRRVEETVDEVELLIVVTPEYVDPLDPHQVPPCGPGMFTTSPSSHELYLHGYLEVPTCPDGTCGPMNWHQGGMVAPDGSAVIMSPDAQGMPLYEQVPPGTNGGQGILPEAPNGGPQAPPAPVQGEAYNYVPAAPVTVPAVEATPYRYERSPTYIRGDAYTPTDEPPGPIGPTGYDVQE